MRFVLVSWARLYGRPEGVLDRLFFAESPSPTFLAEGIESIQMSRFPIPQKRAGFRLTIADWRVAG